MLIINKLCKYRLWINSLIGKLVPNFGQLGTYNKKNRVENDPELPNLTAYEDYNNL